MLGAGDRGLRLTAALLLLALFALLTALVVLSAVSYTHLNLERNLLQLIPGVVVKRTADAVQVVGDAKAMGCLLYTSRCV